MKAAWFFIPLLTANAIAYDFDHDGREERIVVREGKTRIESHDATTGEWADADFQLPDAVAALPPDDVLRFFDLNGDGFDDLVRSDEAGIYIALWSTLVKPGLGWEMGWSHLVRAGERNGAANEPPSFAGAEVRIADGELIATRPGAEDARVALRALIAFDMPPPKSPE